MFRPRSATACVSAGLAAILLLSAAAPLAAAATGSATIPQEVGTQARRAVVWVGVPASEPTVLRISSVSVGAPSPDEFQITYENGSFSLDYERVAGGPVTSQFTVTVAGLVEWLPSGDGLFSDGSTVVYTPLGATAFGAIPIRHTQTTTSSGIEVYSFVIQSNSQEVTLNLTISEGFVPQASGFTLTPMEAELTMQVNHHMNETGTRLAVHLTLNTNQRVNLDAQSWDEEHQFSQNEHAVNVTNDAGASSSSAFFAWSDHASVNGQPGDVAVSGPVINETTGAYDFYLSYPRLSSPTNPDGVDVVHDPSLGVVSAAYASLLGLPGTGIRPDLTLYVVSLVAVAGIVAGTAILTNRRRRGGL